VFLARQAARLNEPRACRAFFCAHPKEILTMPVLPKRLLRLAVAMRAELASRRGPDRLVELPAWSWNDCLALARQVRRAELRGWTLAASVLRQDLGCSLRSLVTELTALAEEMPRTPRPERLAATGDIYRDLVALVDAFREFDYDVRGRWLAVTTEPVTLEDTYLGPFEIRLEWGRPGADFPYRVIATEPHPAQSRDTVTHPHVMDERLCEGEARGAIRQALSQGRLFDFFTLVANGLRSYNPDSPFVALDVWQGASCTDCGAFVDDDQGYVCESCQGIVCEGCEAVCHGCEHSYCGECSGTCPLCDEVSCRDCLRPCAHCRTQVCGGCLDPEDERCTNCHEQLEPQENLAPAHNRAPLQPHGLGQAPLPA
jgi:hypothetical protein